MTNISSEKHNDTQITIYLFHIKNKDSLKVGNGNSLEFIVKSL